MILPLWILIFFAVGTLSLVAWFYLWHRIPEAAEEFSSPGSGRSWIVGLVIPALLIAYSARALANDSFTIYGRGGSWVVEGGAAASFAVALIAAGAALHFHGIWGGTKWLWQYAELGKLLSAIVLVVSLGRGIYLFLLT